MPLDKVFFFFATIYIKVFKNAFMVKLGGFMYKIKNGGKGFTLLELLVVVLIIGILSAIALPQYKKAVAKAQLAQILQITKSINSASQRYYLAYDKYPSKIDDLDIEKNSDVSCGVSSGNIYCYNKQFALWKDSMSTSLECAAKTQDEDFALAQTCKNFTRSSNCYLSSTASTCAIFLKLKPCYVCKGQVTM